MYRRNTLSNTYKWGGGIEPSIAPPLSVVFANKQDESLIIAEEWDVESFPPEMFEPVGIVVIPGYHGVLKDGSGTINQCGVISLVSMYYINPETGNNNLEPTVSWGGASVDISKRPDNLGRYDSITSGMANYNKVITIDGVLSDSDNATLPVSHSTGKAYYTSTVEKAPSPYSGKDLISGPYNELYGTKDADEGTNHNSLSDFKGIINTKIITDLATGEDWKNLDRLKNSYSAGFYPAACCCARYHTIGTKAFKDCNIEELRNGSGFWYMPACGELGYISLVYYDLNKTISKLQDSYNVGHEMYDTSMDYYLSSTEASTSYARAIEFMSGTVLRTDKRDIDETRARAFMRL